MHTPAEKRFSALTDDRALFRCPNCGRGTCAELKDGYLYVIDGHECDDQGCELTMPDDFCTCSNCGWDGTARQVINASKKRVGLVKCPHCKGTGMVRP